MNTPSTNNNATPANQPRPPQTQPQYVPEFEQQPRANPGATYALVGLVGVGVVLLGIGVFGGFGHGAASTPASAAAAPVQNDQLKMMREAMDMAKEAQKLQQERMELMRKQMEEQEQMPAGADK